MFKRDLKKTVNRTMKKMEKVDWNKTAQNASAIAGTVGGAIAITRIATKRNPFRLTKAQRIMKPVKVGAASLAMLAGGIKLLNDNMPKDAKKMMKRTGRRTTRAIKKMM